MIVTYRKEVYIFHIDQDKLVLDYEEKNMEQNIGCR